MCYHALITVLITVLDAMCTRTHMQAVMPIHVHPSDGAEVMHGVGSRLTSNKQGEGDVVAHGSCKASVRLGEAQDKVQYSTAAVQYSAVAVQ
jgi:hypothetical protein